jgi:hypothetical protein
VPAIEIRDATGNDLDPIAAVAVARPLLAAGWRNDYVDLFMATDPGLLDPRRAVPSPAMA